MTKENLVNKLNDMYYNAPKGEKVSMIHLFGIKYSEKTKECDASTKEFSKADDIN